jgi:hypothetical protein
MVSRTTKPFKQEQPTVYTGYGSVARLMEIRFTYLLNEVLPEQV